MVPSGTRQGVARATSPRRRELDALRALVVVGLVFFHSALVFDTRDDYYVKNDITTEAVTPMAGLAVVWAMPLLFLIAGIGTWHSLQGRTAHEFVTKRLRRLLIPLVVGVLVLSPVPVWFRLRSSGAYDASYADFYRRFLDVRLELTDFPFLLAPDAPDGLYEEGHLWFVVMLLAYTFLLLPVFCWLVSPAGRHAVDRLGAAVARPAVILFPAVVLALVTAATPMEEEYAAWGRLGYLAFFCLGFLLAADPRFLPAMRRHAGAALVTGVTCFLAAGILFDRHGDVAAAMVGYEPLAVAGRFLFGAAGWLWLVAIVGWAAPERRTSLSATPTDRAGHGRLLDRIGGYANEAVLPIYVLHQPVVVAVAFYVVAWDLQPAVKYLVISLGSLAAVVALYDVGVRRAPLTRFLFGMNPRSKPEMQAARQPLGAMARRGGGPTEEGE